MGRDVTNYFDALTGIVLVLIVFAFPRGIVGSFTGDGRVRTGLRRFVDDPTVAGAWLSNGGTAVVGAVREWLREVRSVLGVR
jgi:branched-chain amino acid transport system permease protein